MLSARSAATVAGDAESRRLTPTDPELERVVEVWPGLPKHLRGAIAALVANCAEKGRR